MSVTRELDLDVEAIITYWARILSVSIRDTGATQ